jgi:hypothetical protein
MPSVLTLLAILDECGRRVASGEAVKFTLRNNESLPHCFGSFLSAKRCRRVSLSLYVC